MIESRSSSPEKPDRLLSNAYWRGICLVTVAFFAVYLALAIVFAQIVSTDLSGPGEKLSFITFSVALSTVIPVVLISIASAVIGSIVAIATKRRAISVILICWFWLMLAATLASVVVVSRALIKFVNTSP